MQRSQVSLARSKCRTGRRAIKFADSSDVVLSNLCLHNILARATRDQGRRETVRVLKPGGKAVLSDFNHTAT
jgi:hypothetical protein